MNATASTECQSGFFEAKYYTIVCMSKVRLCIIVLKETVNAGPLLFK